SPDAKEVLGYRKNGDDQHRMELHHAAKDARAEHEGLHKHDEQHRDGDLQGQYQTAARLHEGHGGNEHPGDERAQGWHETQNEYRKTQEDRVIDAQDRESEEHHGRIAQGDQTLRVQGPADELPQGDKGWGDFLVYIPQPRLAQPTGGALQFWKIQADEKAQQQ